MMATITNDVKVFEQMNVPTLGMYEFNNLRVPTMLEFGKTYYRERNGKLVAFKIYAYAICKAKDNQHILNNSNNYLDIAYYVQYADSGLRWECKTLDRLCFESKEDYFAHINGIENRSVEWCWDSIYIKIQNTKGLCIDPLHRITRNITLNGRYVWDNTQNKPELRCLYIEYLLFTNDGGIFCVSYNKNCDGSLCNGFATYEECANDHINGMAVVDFEECSFNLNIEVKVVQPTTSIIRVIEVK